MKINFFTIYKTSKFQFFVETNVFLHQLLVGHLCLETKGFPV